MRAALGATATLVLHGVHPLAKPSGARIYVLAALMNVQTPGTSARLSRLRRSTTQVSSTGQGPQPRPRISAIPATPTSEQEPTSRQNTTTTEQDSSGPTLAAGTSLQISNRRLTQADSLRSRLTWRPPPPPPTEQQSDPESLENFMTDVCQLAVDYRKAAAAADPTSFVKGVMAWFKETAHSGRHDKKKEWQLALKAYREEKPKLRKAVKSYVRHFPPLVNVEELSNLRQLWAKRTVEEPADKKSKKKKKEECSKARTAGGEYFNRLRGTLKVLLNTLVPVYDTARFPAPSCVLPGFDEFVPRILRLTVRCLRFLVRNMKDVPNDNVTDDEREAADSHKSALLAEATRLELFSANFVGQSHPTAVQGRIQLNESVKTKDDEARLAWKKAKQQGTKPKTGEGGTTEESPYEFACVAAARSIANLIAKNTPDGGLFKCLVELKDRVDTALEGVVPPPCNLDDVAQGFAKEAAKMKKKEEKEAAELEKRNLKSQKDVKSKRDRKSKQSRRT